MCWTHRAQLWSTVWTCRARWILEPIAQHRGQTLSPRRRPYLAPTDRRGGGDRLGLGANGAPGKQVRLPDGTTGYQLVSFASVRLRGRMIRTLAPWGRDGMSDAGRGGRNRQGGREGSVRS